LVTAAWSIACHCILSSSGNLANIFFSSLNCFT
jgi:hypothetical protein